jgi:4-amino-4-deoxy-L-arabinose transferase-like glycosyltransferase
VILAVTILGRLALLLAVAPSLSLKTSGYDPYAVHLLQGRGYTRLDSGYGDSDVPPLYPLFLAGVYTAVGRHPVAVAVVQLGLEALTTLLVYAVGRRLAGIGVGLLAAAFHACYPYLAFQSVTVNDTTLVVLLLCLSVRLAYLAGDSRRAPPAAALGAALGAASLTKPFAPLLLPLFAVWWWRRASFRNAARLTIVSGAVLIAMLAPWVVRNTRVNGELVFLSTNGGGNLHSGNNSCAAEYMSSGWDVQWATCVGAAPAGLSAVDAERWHREQAIGYLRDHPEVWARLFLTKLRVLWSPAITPAALPPAVDLGDEGAVRLYHTAPFQTARVVHLLYFTPLLILAGIGLAVACHRRLEIGPMVAVPLVITIVYVIFHPSTRYRSPADPFVFVFAAYALTWLATLRRAGGVGVQSMP